MKILFIAILLFCLTACDGRDRPPRPVVDQELRAIRFDKCMEYATKARAGRDYTTNDDEDFDEVINACESAAYYQSIIISPEVLP